MGGSPLRGSDNTEYLHLREWEHQVTSPARGKARRGMGLYDGVDEYMSIDFLLNGEKVTIEADPDRRAVDVLREYCGLTGTKEGCGAGECGACTILVDGESRLSCLMLAAQLAGRVITTIEGIAGKDRLHPLQDAFIQYGAVQCGFCTPGMILSATALLSRNPRPTRADIREGLSGNLCRCTGYQKIVDAVGAAACRKEEST